MRPSRSNLVIALLEGSTEMPLPLLLCASSARPQAEKQTRWACNGCQRFQHRSWLLNYSSSNLRGMQGITAIGKRVTQRALEKTSFIRDIKKKKNHTLLRNPKHPFPLNVHCLPNRIVRSHLKNSCIFSTDASPHCSPCKYVTLLQTGGFSAALRELGSRAGRAQGTSHSQRGSSSWGHTPHSGHPGLALRCVGSPDNPMWSDHHRSCR